MKHLGTKNAAGPRSRCRSGSSDGEASDGEEILETKSTDARLSAASAHAQPKLRIGRIGPVCELYVTNCVKKCPSGLPVSVEDGKRE